MQFILKSDLQICTLQSVCSQRITPVVQSQLPTYFEIEKAWVCDCIMKKLLNMSKMNHFNKTSLFSLTYISKSSFLSIELQSDKEIGKFNFQTRIEEERKKNEKKMTIIIVSKEDPAVCAKILPQEDNNKRFAYICNNFLIRISAF